MCRKDGYQNYTEEMEENYQERDCLVMDMDLVIGGRPDRLLELLEHLDVRDHPPGPELKRLIAELEEKLGIRGT